MSTMRAIAAVLIAGMLAVHHGAAAQPAPFGHACVAQNGVRFCPTTSLADRVPTWDGLPIDIDVTLPPTGDGPFPTIFMLHGLGGSKVDFEAPTPNGTSNATFHYNNVFFAQRGYLVVNYSARGWGNSCGATASRTSDCATGWIRLADQRWEIRDAQHFMGVLVDAGLADPDALGATGVSYGGVRASSSRPSATSCETPPASSSSGAVPPAGGCTSRGLAALAVVGY
jgi:predicted acyl esterase